MLKISILFRSFRSAARGVRVAFYEEQNFRLQLGIAACAVIFGMLFRLSANEWIALAFAIGIVLFAELFNSVLERLLDSMKPRVSLLVGAMKDLMSAAVFITALMALCIGLLLFLPRFIHIFTSLFR
ncbi:diacylglycerol kinase family protein [Candidatus Uhrbacteria bacterium]|nr:diacylglycerol kinase family protein [Candidatus Uhrbacteria bacterium]